jgi:hypothetical protein
LGKLAKNTHQAVGQWLIAWLRFEVLETLLGFRGQVLDLIRRHVIAPQSCLCHNPTMPTRSGSGFPET